MKNLPFMTHLISLLILLLSLFSTQSFAQCRQKYVKATYAYTHEIKEHRECKVDQCTHLKKGIVPYSKDILLFSGGSIWFYQLWATTTFKAVTILFLPVFTITGIGIAFKKYQEDETYIKMINLIDEANILITKNKNSPLIEEFIKQKDNPQLTHQEVALQIIQLNQNKKLCRPKLLTFDQLIQSDLIQ